MANKAHPIPAKEVLQALVSQGMTLRTIAKHFGVGRTTVTSWFDKYEMKTSSGRAARLMRTTDEQRAEMRRLYAQGVTARDIGMRSGVAVRTVRKIVTQKLAQKLIRTDAPRTGPSAYALFCANPFGQAVENVAECV